MILVTKIIICITLTLLIYWTPRASPGKLMKRIILVHFSSLRDSVFVPLIYSGNCDSRTQVGKYFRKHNPFISFDNIRNNSTRCANIVNSAELDDDLASGNLPQYMYFTPNIGMLKFERKIGEEINKKLRYQNCIYFVYLLLL